MLSRRAPFELSRRLRPPPASCAARGSWSARRNCHALVASSARATQPAAAAAVATAVAVTVYATSAGGRANAEPITANRPLSPKHRVGLCGWPVKGARAAGDPRVETLEKLFLHLKVSGYDGMEFGCDDLKEMGFFSWETDPAVVAAAAQAAAATVGFARAGGPSTGVLMKVVDGNAAPPFPGCLDFNQPDFETALETKLRQDMRLGSEYVTFQIYLPDRYLNSGGEYRRDLTYLQKTASRIVTMQRIAHGLGLNFYVETHIDRVSEDIEAFVKIIELAGPTTFELNGDLSHYYYRGISKGTGLPKLLAKIGHMHQRMARQHGDLSAEVADPYADWAAGGLTRQAYDYAVPALAGGLTSRIIMGESGNMHLVTDALSLDAKLVPLWRAMAAYADTQVIDSCVDERDSDADDSPWQAQTKNVSTAVASAYSRANVDDIATAEKVLARHWSKQA